MGPEKLHLINLVYEVLAKPERMTRLLEHLADSYQPNQREEVQPAVPPGGHNRLDLRDVEEHFDRAAEAYGTLLTRAIREDKENTKDQGVLEIPVAADGRVLCSPQQKPHTGLGDNITDMDMDADVARAVKRCLRDLRAGKARRGLLLFWSYGANGNRTFWQMHPSPSSVDGAVAHIQRLGFEWSDTAGDALVGAFRLSGSERKILQAIIEGRRLSDYAQTQNRSIQTVRTQAKALLAKTGAGSQIELVRMFAAVSLASPTPAKNAPITLSQNPAMDRRFVALPSGRHMQIDMQGPQSGHPVLFFHGMFSGSELTGQARRALEQSGLRLVCPWRAGYAGSSPHDHPPKDPLTAFMADLDFIVSDLGLPPTLAVGHQSSAIYAAAAPSFLPKNIMGAVSLSGYPPFLSHQQFDLMPPGPRIFAYTARHHPRVLAMLIKSSISLLYGRGTEVLLNTIYGRSKVDMTSLRHLEIKRLALAGLRSAFAQGSSAYETDAILASTDWSDWLNNGAIDRFVHIAGALDDAMPAEPITFARRYAPCIDTQFIPGAGQLLLFQAPETVFALIGAELERLSLRPA